MITLDELRYHLTPLFSPHTLEKFNQEIEDNFSPVKKFDGQKISDLRNRVSYQFPKKIITIAALKGGVGKTFLTTTVAFRLAELGARCLIIDLDPEACATNSLLEGEVKIEHTLLEILKGSISFQEAILPTKYPGIHVVGSALRMAKAENFVLGKNPKTLLKNLLHTHSYDFVFFELPPSFATIQAAAYLSSELLILPCTPNIHSLESIELTLEAIEEASREFEGETLNYKIILNRYNPRRTSSQDTLALLKDDYSANLLPFQIPESADIQNAINSGKTIYETKCAHNIKGSINQLIQVIFARPNDDGSQWIQ